MRKVTFEYSYLRNIPESIRERSSFMTLEKGETLFKEGDKADYVWITLSGRCGILNEKTGGESDRFVWILPGEIMGEIEVLGDDETFAFSAVSYENKTEVLRIEKKVFLEWIGMDNSACMDLAKTLARKLLATSVSLCERSNDDSMTLVCDFIINIVKKEVHRSAPVMMRYTRSEIASGCGLSERTINRCINRLKKLNFVSIINGKIAISMAQYEAICQANEEGLWILNQ